MITAIYNHLHSDSELLATLTGGVWLGYDVHEISRQNTPAAFDGNKELLPCALLQPETATPWGPNRDSGRQYFVLYLYQRHGYTAIEAARQRIYTLLHRQILVPTDGSGCYEILHSNDLLGLEDSALDGAALTTSRFYAVVQRK